MEGGRLHPFRLAVQDRDIASIAAMLTPDVKLYSPIPYRPFEGREHGSWASSTVSAR